MALNFRDNSRGGVGCTVPHCGVRAQRRVCGAVQAQFVMAGSSEASEHLRHPARGIHLP